MSDNYYLYNAAHTFIKEKDKYNVESLLSNNCLFDRFIHNLSGLELNNATGGSYCSVCLAFYKDGVLLISKHHSNDICYIKIASNPNSKWFLGDQDSRYSGDPHPRLENGIWVTVWDYSSKKLKDGPWVNKVKDVIQYALDLANTKSINLINKEKEEIAAQNKEKEEFDQNLIKNWSLV